MPSIDPGVVLITGCSSGLGREAARLFRAAKCGVVATARDDQTIADLRTIGCETLSLDVTDEASMAAAVAAVEQKHGSVGVLVNNAGYGQCGPIEEIPIADMRRSFETNVFGLIRMVQLVLPGMRSAGRGRIVNVSSLAGRISIQGGGVYHMTKYSVEALADALRPEVKPFGIDVVNILPGPFASDYRDKVVASIPDTGPDSPYLIYKRSLGKYMYDFLEPTRFGVMPATQVARVIVKAATARKPRARYSVGFYAKFGPMGHALAPEMVVSAYMNRKIPHR